MSPRLSASAPLDQISEDTPKELKRTALSFEVIPPRHDADAAKIDRLLAMLAAYNPDYIAVTSSQRSGWLEGTAAFIEKISRDTAMRPLAHLACTAGTEEELVGWIDTLVDAGVRGLLALRGDLPEGGMPEGHLPHADSLVRLIRRWESDRVARLAAGRLAVGVACYPNGHAESATPTRTSTSFWPSSASAQTSPSPSFSSTRRITSALPSAPGWQVCVFRSSPGSCR